MAEETSHSFTIRLLTKDCTGTHNIAESDIEGANAVITDAFGCNELPPNAPSFLAGENRYSPELGRWQIECGIVAGRVYVAETTTGEIVGAAVWFGPGEEVLKSSPVERQKVFFDRFLSVLRANCPGMAHWWVDHFLPRIDQFAAEALGDATAQRDSWCLHLLGVSNKFKGRGIGTVMIQVVQKEASRGTNNRERRLTVMAGPVDFHRSVGFVLLDQTEIESEESLGMKASFFFLACDVQPEHAT
ncbi:hypothetical protein BC629DRAFT_1619607 [Irpex lacteus]|nr:hypothetical protein BC629DRAFT_1619607 [Irpex lacteus]